MKECRYKKIQTYDINQISSVYEGFLSISILENSDG